MFHHFCDDEHPAGQGALSAADLHHLLDWIANRGDVVQEARSFSKAMRSRFLSPEDTCLTFDDGLLCQYEIALPILEERGLTGFFFVYSSIFTQDPDPLEIYRFFRTVAYETVDQFYLDFVAGVELQHPAALRVADAAFDPQTYLADFPFYTDGDRQFRLLRDRALTERGYHEVMQHVMSSRGFSSEGVAEKVWMTAEQVADLHKRGHVVGLHSHSHPTMIHELSRDAQQAEYAQNMAFLTDIVGTAPTCMSHPCGNYNHDTLTVLQELGIDIGFRSNLAVPEVRSNLEIPREDHANVWREMQA